MICSPYVERYLLFVRAFILGFSFCGQILMDHRSYILEPPFWVFNKRICLELGAMLHIGVVYGYPPVSIPGQNSDLHDVNISL